MAHFDAVLKGGGPISLDWQPLQLIARQAGSKQSYLNNRDIFIMARLGVLTNHQATPKLLNSCDSYNLKAYRVFFTILLPPSFGLRLARSLALPL